MIGVGFVLVKMYDDFHLEEHRVTLILLDEAQEIVIKQESFTTLKQAEDFMAFISATFPAAS